MTEIEHSEDLEDLRIEIERLNRVVIRGLAGVELSEENDRLIDEVERLRAALREIVTTDPPSASDDWFQEWKNLAFRLKGIARRTLEGK